MRKIRLFILLLSFNLQAQQPAKRMDSGQLNEQDFSMLKSNLSVKEIKSDFILIIYYPGKDKCNGMERVSTWNVFDQDFTAQLNIIVNHQQFWVYKNDENLKYYHPEEVTWQLDKEALVEQLFFKQPYPCASFVVIDQKANYISFFGEFGKQHVWKVSEELVKLK